MARDDGAQRTDYGSKAGEIGRSKEISSASWGDGKLAGGKATAGASGPTGSSRSYPKGGRPGTNPSSLNPMNDKSGADFAVGGVGKGEG